MSKSDYISKIKLQYSYLEDWRIDEWGRIHSEDDIYESYEEFLREWI